MVRVRYLTTAHCAQRLNDGYATTQGLVECHAFTAAYIRGEIRDGRLVAALRLEKDGVSRRRDFFGVLESDWRVYLAQHHPRLVSPASRAS